MRALSFLLPTLFFSEQIYTGLGQDFKPITDEKLCIRVNCEQDVPDFCRFDVFGDLWRYRCPPPPPTPPPPQPSCPAFCLFPDGSRFDAISPCGKVGDSCERVSSGQPGTCAEISCDGTGWLCECVPNNSGNGTVTGDPHFTSWGGKRFDFHGECDLVLGTSPSFGNGLGLDVHIRTTMVSRAVHAYSYISEAAVRIGQHVLAVAREEYWLDGVPHQFEDATSFSLAGYNILISDSTTKRGKFMKQFFVDLGDGYSITVKAAKSHIDVSMNVGTSGEHFHDVVGLLGRIHDRVLVDRNGNSMEDSHENHLGQMWQVREWEDTLFPSIVGPQHPTKCNLPPVTQNSRHLRSAVDAQTLRRAEAACEHVAHDSDRDNCVFDVLATGDFEMADFYDE